MQFRKKPVVIEAVQFKGSENMPEIDAFLNAGTPAGAPAKHGFQAWPERVVIHTLEGIMYGNVGDWIIRGVKGEFYPCKPDIFEATYEPVEEAIPA